MRLFIAMPLPLQIEEALGKIILALKQSRSNVKWVDSGNIHLTLKFLGETDEKKVDNIIEGIKRVGVGHKTVKSRLEGLGGFPNLRKPRIIWAGLSEGVDILAKIAADIENEMEKLNFEKENRPFKSHLTLGRVKDTFGLAELTRAIENYKGRPEDFILDKIVLFKSTLTPRGPIYERLFELELRN